MKGPRMPTQAEIDAIDPAELMAGLRALNLGERIVAIQYRDEASAKLWAAFCERWKLKKRDNRTKRGGTRKYFLSNVRVAAAELGVSQHTIEKALRTGRVTTRIVEGMLEIPFCDWSAKPLKEQVDLVKARLAWWAKHRAPVLGHGDRGAYERMLRARWAKRRRKRVNSEQCAVNSGETNGGKA